VQYGYSNSPIDINRIEKPDNITWSDEIQEKITRRGLKIENRINEPKWFIRNKTIMDMVVKYIQETNVA